jgi:hypothetical protein
MILAVGISFTYHPFLLITLYPLDPLAFCALLHDGMRQITLPSASPTLPRCFPSGDLGQRSKDDPGTT